MSRPSGLSLQGGAQNAQKARQAFVDGQKAIQTGVFHWKPEWEKGASCFTEAARLYKLAGPDFATNYIEALIASAPCFEKTDSPHTAAKNLESAATELAKMRGEEARAAQIFANSAAKYRLAEHPDKAAANLFKAGKLVGDHGDIEGAVSLFDQCLSVFEEESRGHFSNDTFKAIIGWLLKNGRQRDCVRVLERQNAIYKKLGTFDPYLHKNFLALVVLLLHLEEYDRAENEFKQSQDYGRFASTEEAEVAQELLDALHMASNEQLKAVTKKQIFTFLDNEVARLAQRLAFDEEKVRNRVIKPTEDHSLDDKLL